MARYEGGWTKFHRPLNRHHIGQDAISFAIFMRLISWANVKQSKYYWNGQVKFLERGQVLTTIRELAESFAAEPLVGKTVERKLKMMEIDGTIVQQVSNHGRVITISNYDKYQGYDDDEEDTTVEPKSNESQTKVKRKSNESHNKEEINNNKKERTKESNTLPPTVVVGELAGPVQDLVVIKKCSDGFLDIATRWFEYANREYPWKRAKVSKSWTVDAFGTELERVARIMNLNMHGLNEILNFVEKDEFWRTNAASPFGLMKKGKNDMRKIENILARMRTKQHRTDEAIHKWAHSSEEFKSPFDVEG